MYMPNADFQQWEKYYIAENSINTDVRRKHFKTLTEQRIYERAVQILDDFYTESRDIIPTIMERTSWKEDAIFRLFKQSSHILFALLSNTQNSKFKNENYVVELIYIGSLGRIIRDIYLKIIYLRTNKFSDEEMKLCCDYQIICQKLNVTKFEAKGGFHDAIMQLEIEKDEVKRQLELISFSTKGQVFQGKEEKLLSLKELADLKNFDKDKFEGEFSFFSQFSHSTAFANNFITSRGVSLSIIAATYHKIVAYYVGTVTEAIDLFIPDHKQIVILKEQYKEIIRVQWTLIASA
jgi:hypothetical protein